MQYIYCANLVALFLIVVSLSFVISNKHSNSAQLYFEADYLSKVSARSGDTPSLSTSLPNHVYCRAANTASLSATFLNHITKDNYYAGCPTESWLEAMSSLRPSKRKLTFINIGCNKGYNLAIWMNRFITSDINATVWFQHVWGGHPSYKGVCNDYKDSHPPVVRTDTDELLLVGIDLNKQNLQTIWNKTSGGWLRDNLRGHAKVQLYLFHAVGGDGSESISLAPCAVGDEVCSVEKLSSTSPKVPSIAVDQLIVDLQSRNITDTSIVDILMIDTEGHDPLVLQGARKSIHSGLVRCVVFEYHKVGVWPYHKLRHIVERFDAANYECYFQGKGELFPISGGCWHDKYEFYWWSNVMCIRRDDVWHHAVQKYVKLVA